MSSKLKIVRKGYPRYYPTGGPLWNINLRLGPPTQSDWNAFNNIDWSDPMLSRIAMTNLGGLGRTFKIGADRLVNNFGNTDNYSLMKMPSLFGATRSDTGVSTGTGTKGGFLKMSTKKVSRPKTPEEMQKEKNRLALMSAGLNAVGSIDTGDPRGAFDTLDPVYHLAGGRESKVGNALSDTGVSLTKTGNPWLMLAGAGLKVIGGLTNAAWGIKENKANVDFINNSIANKRNSGNLLAQATTSDELLKSSGTMTGGSGFGVGDLYEGGWFSGDSATNKGKSLIGLEVAATNFLNHGLMTGALSVDLIGDDNIMRNFTAYGGPLESIDPSTAIGYSFMNLYIANRKQDRTASNMFAGTSDNMFNIGGPLFATGGNIQTHGSNFTNNLVHVNTGGTHEESPELGVQMGVDLEGTPNLVEEGEVIYNDYVFSNRLTVPKFDRKDKSQEARMFRKYSGKTFADAAKKIEKRVGADERIDDITQKGLDAELELLAQLLEEEREKEKALQLKDAIDLMSPEELAMLQQQMLANLELANLLAMQELMMQQQQMQLPLEVPMEQLQQYLSGYPQEAMQMAPEQMALGGNLYAAGSNLENNNEWLLRLTPEYKWLVDTLGITNKAQFDAINPYYKNALINLYNRSLKYDSNESLLELYNNGYFDLDLYRYLNDRELMQNSFNSISGEQWKEIYDNYLKDYNKFNSKYPSIPYSLRNDESYKRLWDDTFTPLESEENKVDTNSTDKSQEAILSTSVEQLGEPIRSVAAHYGKEPDAWNKLSEAEKNEYIRKYRREGLKNREERRNFDLELENYNNKVAVEEFLKKQRNSTLNDNDIKDIDDFSTLERLAKTVNSNYLPLNLGGKSINELNAAKDKLKKDIVQWSKDNNVTIGNINDSFTTDRYKDWSTVNPDEAWKEVDNGYNLKAFNEKLNNYTGSLDNGNTDHTYGIDSNFDLENFKSIEDLEASDGYKAYTEALKDAVKRNQNAKWGLDENGNIQLGEGQTFNKESDYDLLNTLNATARRSAIGDTGIFTTDDNGYITFDPEAINNIDKRRTDHLAGVYHLTPTKDISKNRELYKVKDVDGYFNPSNDWKDYYDEISVENTSDANGTTTTHTLAPKKGISITRATSLPEDIEVDTNGNYIKVDPKTKRTVGIKGDATFPKAPNWPYLLGAGLLGGALLYNLLSPKDYSNADAMIKAGMLAGLFRPVEFRPEGTFLTYKPMDIWREQNRLDANARAVDRSLANNAAPISTQMAALIGNAYKNQLANADLHMKGLEYNDTLAERKGTFNRATGQFNSEGFLKADMANQEAAARARGYQLEGLKSGYAMRQAIDDAKASAINAGINGIASNIMNYALNKYNLEMLAWLLQNNPYPIPQMPGYDLRTGSYRDAKGGKLKRRKKGLSF